MHAHSHSHVPATAGNHERYREIRKVTLIGSVVDFALGVAKIVVGMIAHSQALIADGIHSLSDLLTDFLVIFAAKHAHREADACHPYGHGRIETLMTVALGVSLILVAGGIAWDAGRRLFHPDLLLQPGMMAMLVALISVLAKEAIYHYTMRQARRVRSNMLRANAWHSRSDAISSIVVMVGIGGTMAGLPYLDAIAAVLVGMMVAKIGWDLSWSSARELIDTALEEDEVQQIRDTIREVGGVRELHMLRTRRSGSDALVDVHVQVDPRLSVSEGHQIGERVRQALLKDVEVVTDVTVHVDPEDDSRASPCDHLPLRSELLGQLHRNWAGIPELEQVQEINLHYLNGEVHIDVVLPLELDQGRDAARALVEQLKQRAATVTDVGRVRVLFA
ncbi:MAG TPA: cation diffusion facilitator family transporter [Thiohalobacter sp.]|nr:cation diffusion facilitator family transporter [Thiohalobacter sp.]